MRYLKTYKKIFESIDKVNKKEIEERIDIVVDCLQEVFDDYDIKYHDNSKGGYDEDFFYPDQFFEFSYFEKDDGEMIKCRININTSSKEMTDLVRDHINKLTPYIIDKINCDISVFLHDDTCIVVSVYDFL